MPAALSARLFTDVDAAPLTALLHQAYAELGERGLNFTAVDQTVETTRYRARGGQCWLIEADGTIVATLTMSMPPSDALRSLTMEAHLPARAWLNQMAVAPHFRGRGLARHLWDLGRRWAIDHGATSVGVDTAEPATHLTRLYGSWGFERCDRIHWDGKTYDSIVMVRALP